MQTVTCPKCKEINTGVTLYYCQHCGYSLENVSSGEVAQSRYKRRSLGKSQKRIIVGVVLLLGACLVGLYALFSTRSQRQTPLSDLESLLGDEKFVLFDGYEKAELTYLNIGSTFSTDSSKPQGTTARTRGVVTYAGGHTGHFEAVLELEAGKWKLYNINVTVPPDKVGD
jgi:hypothetical protein